MENIVYLDEVVDTVCNYCVDNRKGWCKPGNECELVTEIRKLSTKTEKEAEDG